MQVCNELEEEVDASSDEPNDPWENKVRVEQSHLMAHCGSLNNVMRDYGLIISLPDWNTHVFIFSSPIVRPPSFSFQKPKKFKMQ